MRKNPLVDEKDIEEANRLAKELADKNDYKIPTWQKWRHGWFSR